MVLQFSRDLDLIACLPQVDDITAEELHRLLEEHAKDVVLIDVRTIEERQISQLPGRVLTPEEFDAQKDSLKKVTTVCYW